MDKTTSQIDIDKGNSKEYQVKAICDNKFFAKESDSSHHLPGFYYLILWKSYLEKENIWKLVLAIQHLWKLVITFHKEHPEKPIATFPPIGSALPMARPTIKSRTEAFCTKQKHGRPAKANGPNKRSKRAELLVFCLVFGPVSIADKRCSQSRDALLCSTLLHFAQLRSLIFDFSHFSIFTYLPIFFLSIGQEVFFIKLFNSFGFLLPVLQKI